MIEKMTRYDFILPSGGTEDFLGKIQDLGVVDITRSTKAIDDESAEMLARADALRRRMVWISKEDFLQDPDYAALSVQAASLRKEEELRSHWGQFDPEAIASLESAGQKIHFHCTAAKQFDPEWQKRYALQTIDNDGKKVWFVAVGENDGLPGEIPAPEGTATQAREQLSALEKSISERAAQLRSLKDGLPQMKAEYDALLAEADFHFASAAVQKAAENSLTVITGFAPSRNDSALKAEFDACDVLYLSAEADVEDQPPIKLRNNRFVSMFEVLTDMYGRPSYDGFDPTPYISIFFLLFFAMCMGDAGYGLVLIAVGFLLRKTKGFANLAPLVMTLGGATVVVGFLFHTFFSIDISGAAFIPDALKKCMVPAKISTYDSTMVLALIVGIVHLCLAMIVKTVYATRNRGFLRSLGVWGWTLLIVGGVAVGAVSLMGVIGATPTKVAVTVLGIVSALGIFLLNDLERNPLKNIGAGLWEAYNTATGVLGDVLSYLRLYALGLAGSMLGFAFNDLAVMARGDGGFGWIAFILIVIVGHTLNLAMAALGAFVHPLRLNFLEFFKNSGYEGSGRNYNPLKRNNQQ